MVAVLILKSIFYFDNFGGMIVSPLLFLSHVCRTQHFIYLRHC